MQKLGITQVTAATAIRVAHHFGHTIAAKNRSKIRSWISYLVNAYKNGAENDKYRPKQLNKKFVPSEAEPTRVLPKRNSNKPKLYEPTWPASEIAKRTRNCNKLHNALPTNLRAKEPKATTMFFRCCTFPNFFLSCASKCAKFKAHIYFRRFISSYNSAHELFLHTRVYVGAISTYK